MPIFDKWKRSDNTKKTQEVTHKDTLAFLYIGT